MRILAALLAAILALAPAVHASDKAERLEHIRVEIEEREAMARSFADEAVGYLGELEAIDRELTETRRSLTRLKRRQQTAGEELREAERAAAEAARDLETKRIELRQRLVALYKFRATGGLPALYSAVDFQGLMRLSRGLGRVVESDAALFSRFAKARVRWGARRAERAGLVAELRQAAHEVERRNDAVRHKLVERKNLVALLRSRAEKERQAAAELREAAQRLEQTLAALPRQGGASTGPGLRRGHVVRPVSGPVRLGFGRQIDPEFGTETLRTGIQIEVPAGTSVRTVAAGRVLFAGWFRGYGQMVIVDHGSRDMTVSGYLEDLAVSTDQSVEAGEVLGTVGQTGSLLGPGLYFEIRQAGEPVDPETWFE